MTTRTTAADIAAVLEFNRDQQKLTRSELATAAGMTRVTLRHALEGHDIRVSTLLALCDRLGLDLALVPRGLGQALATGTPVATTGPGAANLSAMAPHGPGNQLDQRTVLGAALQRLRPAP